MTPSRVRPFGGCEPNGPEFAACLGHAADLADRAVDSAEQAAIAGLPSRPGANPVVADDLARGLRSAGETWRQLRDRECLNLPLVETGLEGSLFLRRLICRIRRDVERIESLRDRYGPG